MSTDVFALPDHLAAKTDPALIGADRAHFAAVAASLERQVAELTERLEVLRRAPAGKGRRAVDRDLEIHRLTGRLRLLRRFGLDVCLGRMVPDDGAEPAYVGRIGLTDESGRRLLIDWRTPAAEPFFAATYAHPLGLVSRRRYRWTQGRITDYWDEVFTADGLDRPAALDADSAFIASLGASRSDQMRDVLGTIQADQDAIIRAGSHGALVVDGGPGTGKTVVALHRAAYLLYADPRLSGRRGGLLVVGPHRPYLAYIADVLPSLGEDGVRTCTLRDLLPEGATTRPEADPEVARLKADARLVAAIEPAVALYEEPPRQGLLVETDEGDVWVSPGDWAEAFESVEPATPHNEAHAQIWDLLLTNLVDRQIEEDDEDPGAAGRLRAALRRSPELIEALNRAWTLVEPTDLVGDLWSVPAYLRRCAPWLSVEQVRALQRDEPQAWTVADLPLLDAARRRLGDPETDRRERRRQASYAAQRAEMDEVVDYLLRTDDDAESSLIMLRGDDLRRALLDPDAVPAPDPDALAGPFAHIVVDEAQELTDAEWQMLLSRCQSRSFTVVGDRAQARHGFPETWAERLARVGFGDVGQATLTINYRTPQEVMAAAEPVIRAVFPEANVPTSIRPGGTPVRHGSVSELDAILNDWLAAHPEGTACVIGTESLAARPRVRSLTPESAKGMEFDLVVLIDPDSWGRGVEAAVDRYVAMTRATQQLVILGRASRRRAAASAYPGC